MHKNWQTCGHELPTNLQNFTQKESTEVKIVARLPGAGRRDERCVT